MQITPYELERGVGLHLRDIQPLRDIPDRADPVASNCGISRDSMGIKTWLTKLRAARSAHRLQTNREPTRPDPRTAIDPARWSSQDDRTNLVVRSRENETAILE